MISLFSVECVSFYNTFRKVRAFSAKNMTDKSDSKHNNSNNITVQLLRRGKIKPFIGGFDAFAEREVADADSTVLMGFDLDIPDGWLCLIKGTGDDPVRPSMLTSGKHADVRLELVPSKRRRHRALTYWYFYSGSTDTNRAFAKFCFVRLEATPLNILPATAVAMAVDASQAEVTATEDSATAS